MDEAHEKVLAKHEMQRRRAQERHDAKKLKDIEKAKPHHDDLDETLADTFPSSDPPAVGGETSVPPKPGKF